MLQVPGCLEVFGFTRLDEQLSKLDKAHKCGKKGFEGLEQTKQGFY